MKRSLKGTLKSLLWLTCACIGLTAMQPTTAHAEVTLAVSDEQVFFIPVPAKHLFEVIQVSTLTNRGNLTQSFHFSVPAGATGVQVSPGGATRSGSEWTVPRAVKQGQRQSTVSRTYFVPFDQQDGQQVVLSSDYPVYAAHLFLPIGDVALSASNLQFNTQTTVIDGTKFRVFDRPNGLGAGESWPISLQVLPSVGPSSSVSGLPIIGMDNNGPAADWQALTNLLLALVVLSVGLFSIRATQGSRRMRKSERDALFDAWVRLEQQFVNGQVSDKDYKDRRSRYKARLLALQPSGKSHQGVKAHD